MTSSFDYQGARKAGYSDEEIMSHLSQQHPKFDFKGATAAGYRPEEIIQHLYSTPKEPEDNRGLLEKGVTKTSRLASQGLIGGIQRATAAYDIPAIFGRKLAIANAPQEFRQNIFQDIESLQDQKASGDWSEQDQQRYDSLVDLIKNPEKMQEFLPKEENVPNFDVGSLIEKGAKQFGVDLAPQGADEMALRWIGFIKDPSKAGNLLKNGFNPQNAKEVLKALAPTGKEALRGVGAGTAIEYAAENELGPIGTMAAAILGDMAPSLAAKTLSVAAHPIQAGKSAIQSGKKLAAKGISAVTPRDKVGLQQAIIKDFKDAGIQADLGTISGNSIVKWMQSTLAQSGLTGAPLEEFKKSLTKNITSEYKKVVSDLGHTIYETRGEAGQALKNGLKEARDVDISEARNLYNSAKQRAGNHQVFTGNVGSIIEKLEEDLTPGSYKSAEQKAVLDIIRQVRNDVLTPEGGIKGAEIKALINNKIALNDAINYEVQGGAKQLLKQLVGELDKAISSHGKVDPQFAKEWQMANAKFAQHAKTFRGKTISDALKSEDPSIIFSKMNSTNGIEQIKKALSVTPEGRELFKQLSAFKMEEMIGKNMVDGVTNQLNFGTFSKILDKNQNRDVVRSILGKDGLHRLENIQKASGRLNETAQKFLNTSRSGVHVQDLAAAGKILFDFGNLFAGNPWPLLKSGGTYLAVKQFSKLISDPEFIKLVEEAMMESRNPTSQAFKNAGIRLAKRAQELAVPAQASIVNESS